MSSRPAGLHSESQCKFVQAFNCIFDNKGSGEEKLLRQVLSLLGLRKVTSSSDLISSSECPSWTREGQRSCRYGVYLATSIGSSSLNRWEGGACVGTGRYVWLGNKSVLFQ
jgi:hypothetical protein